MAVDDRRPWNDRRVCVLCVRKSERDRDRVKERERGELAMKNDCGKFEQRNSIASCVNYFTYIGFRKSTKSKPRFYIQPVAEVVQC